MREPEQIGKLFDLTDRARLLALARTPQEVHQREERLARLDRIGGSGRAQSAVERLHDAASVARSEPIVERDRYCQEGLEWAAAWSPDSPGAIVWGRAGSGKTTLMQRLVLRLGGQGCSVCLVSLDRLIPALAEADFSGGYGELLDGIGRVDVLVLDDWGTSPIVRGRGRFLWAALDARWLQRKPLLVTSNISPDFSERVGLRYDPDDAAVIDRALDRLHALAPTHVRYDSPVSRRKAEVREMPSAEGEGA
jgi:hypothetical protein